MELHGFLWVESLRFALALNWYTWSHFYLIEFMPRSLLLWKSQIFIENRVADRNSLVCAESVWMRLYNGFMSISMSIFSQRKMCLQSHLKTYPPSLRFFVGILIFLLLMSPCKFSKSYNKPLWEKSNLCGEKERKRKHAVNSGHLVPWQRSKPIRPIFV